MRSQNHSLYENEISENEISYLDYSGIFDDLFKTYTREHSLIRVKTTNMGSLYKLFYKVQLKDRTQMQAFMDDLRVRNGNLEISLAEAEDSAEEL